MSTKQDNIIFMDGKEKGLKALFNSENFGFLALGKNQDADTNGFINPPVDDPNTSNGFYEIDKQTEDSTYDRVALYPQETIRNPDNGEVTVKFLAEFDTDNIVSGITINQLAIVDSQTANDSSTTFYAAAVCDDDFNKSEQLAIVFVLELTI